jgi:hypothetical protein
MTEDIPVGTRIWFDDGYGRTEATVLEQVEYQLSPEPGNVDIYYRCERAYPDGEVVLTYPVYQDEIVRVLGQVPPSERSKVTSGPSWLSKQVAP